GQAIAEANASAALVSAVGATRAAELVAQFRPYNLTEAPPAGFTRQTTTVRVAFLVLPRRDDVDAKSRSWMTPALAILLPERLVMLVYVGGAEVLNQLSAPVDAPFAVSLDPAGTAESQMQFDEHGNLVLGDDLHWIADFDEAVRRGMGFRVDLSPQTA